MFAKRMMEELSRDYQFDSLTYKEWSNTVPESLFFLVQELVLYVGIGIITNHEGENVSNRITETALNSLLAAFGEDVKDNGNGKGMQTIWNNSVFLGIVSRCIRNISHTPSNSAGNMFPSFHRYHGSGTHSESKPACFRTSSK